MRAWLVYDEAGRAANEDYIARHRRVGAEFGVEVRLRMAEELWEEMTVPGSILADNNQKPPDFAIVRTICPALSKRLEERGIPVFNPWKVSSLCNDKGKTIEYVRRHTDVPCVPTRRYANPMLSKDLLSDRDCVIKSVDGHGGRQVFSTKEAFSAIAQGIGSSDFVIQPFIHGPGEDVRVYVIGSEPVAAVKRRAGKDFRANFSLGGAVQLYTLSFSEREMVEKICRIFPFGLAGIDFLINERKEFVLNEIEDVVGARMLYQCAPDIRLLERYFSFILNTLRQSAEESAL